MTSQLLIFLVQLLFSFLMQTAADFNLVRQRINVYRLG